MKLELNDEARIVLVVALIGLTIVSLVSIHWYFANENDKAAFAAGYSKQPIAGSREPQWVKTP